MLGADRHLVAAGGATSELEGRARRRRAILGELHHLSSGDQVAESFCALQFDLRRASEVGAEIERPPDGVDDAWKGVAEPDGSEAHAVLDELIAVRIPHVRAEAVCEDRWRSLRVLVGTLGIGMAAARYQLAQPLGQPFGVAEVHGVTS